MYTTYVEIWNEFEPIAKFDEYDLPNSIDGRKSLIKSGVKIFNQKMFDMLECDSIRDVLSRKLNDSELNLLAHCMRLQVCRNIQSEFTTTYDIYQGDLGFKNYKAQLDGRETLVVDEEREVDKIVFSMQEDYEG